MNPKENNRPPRIMHRTVDSRAPMKPKKADPPKPIKFYGSMASYKMYVEILATRKNSGEFKVIYMGPVKDRK